MSKRIVLGWSIVAFLVGVLGFACANHWIIINIPFFHQGVTSAPLSVSERKTVSFHLPRKGVMSKESRDILCSTDAIITADSLVRAWLNLLDEEGLLEKKTTLQVAAGLHKNSVLLISFDRSFLPESTSTREKVLLVESLLATLRELRPPFGAVLFLVHHQPMDDEHLDFSQPWPLEGFLSHPVRKDLTPKQAQKTSGNFTIMLAPAGDAQQTGRLIGDSFERSVTLACAQELKTYLEREVPSCRIILTRTAGDTVEPLQNATFSNRLRTDLFIGIHAYQEAAGPATCSLFHFLGNPVADFWNKKESPFVFPSYFLAHVDQLPLSILLALKLQAVLGNLQRQGKIKTFNLVGLPFRPLVGVQAPAFALECGLPQKDSFRPFIPPLVEAIKSMVDLLSELAVKAQNELDGQNEQKIREMTEASSLPFVQGVGVV